jgi:hypothetical protein
MGQLLKMGQNHPSKRGAATESEAIGWEHFEDHRQRHFNDPESEIRDDGKLG